MMIVNVWRLSRSIYYCLKLCCLHLILFTLIRIDAKSIVSQSLDGQDWIVYDSDKQSIIVSAKVPGSIYSDLQRHSILGEFYTDFNDVKYRWVSYLNWTYLKIFPVRNLSVVKL
ncbi:hypothetical protein SSS_07327 [Sarcoptes scabiei]|nr:hypothetical protein SSS_07327 [Sarcoptes scabiei]